VTRATSTGTSGSYRRPGSRLQFVGSCSTRPGQTESRVCQERNLGSGRRSRAEPLRHASVRPGERQARRSRRSPRSPRDHSRRLTLTRRNVCGALLAASSPRTSQRRRNSTRSVPTIRECARARLSRRLLVPHPALFSAVAGTTPPCVRHFGDSTVRAQSSRTAGACWPLSRDVRAAASPQAGLLMRPSRG
jgi:hypothetical protein